MILQFRNCFGEPIQLDCVEGDNGLRDYYLASVFFGLNPAIYSPKRVLNTHLGKVEVEQDHFREFGRLLFSCVSGQYEHLTFHEQLLIWSELTDEPLSATVLYEYWLRAIRCQIHS